MNLYPEVDVKEQRVVGGQEGVFAEWGKKKITKKINKINTHTHDEGILTLNKPKQDI